MKRSCHCLQRAVNKLLWPLVSIMQLAIRTEHGIIWVSMPSQGAFSVRASHTELSGWFYFYFFFSPGHPQAPTIIMHTYTYTWLPRVWARPVRAGRHQLSH